MSSLVVQTSFIGDVVLTTPLISKLARDGDVEVLTTRAGSALLRSHPDVSRVIVYDKRGSDSGALGFIRAARSARGAHAAYMCQGSLRSGALALAAGCERRTGFDTSGGRAFYNERVTYRDDWHHARRLLSLAGSDLAERASFDEIRPRLYPAADDVAAVDEVLGGRSRPFIALAPGSAWGSKRWPGFGELAALLSDDFDIAIVGSADDVKRGVEIQRLAPRECVVDAAGRLSLLGSAELIRRAACLVSNDSSPQHLASAMNTPTVTLFGPTVPEFGFGPLASGSRTIGRDHLDCRPCDRHGPPACPLGHWRCMREISPQEVANMVRATVSGPVAQ